MLDKFLVFSGLEAVELIKKSLDDTIQGSTTKPQDFDCVFMVECALLFFLKFIWKISSTVTFKDHLDQHNYKNRQDREMPVMDGVEATRHIMALQLGQKSRVPVPIIGVSASVESADDWRAAGTIDTLLTLF
jgi:CheY-like chemotaxis protein